MPQEKRTRSTKSSGKRVSRIKLTESARADILRLPVTDQKRIGKRLRTYESSDDPMKFAKRLVSSKIGQYRFRIGPYRLSFDVRRGTIYILRVGDRKDIYR